MKVDENLIEEVRRHGELYDFSSPGYKNIMEKDRIWKGIGRRLGIPDEFARKRWKGLRDTFNRNRRHFSRRRKYLQPGESDEFQPKWKYYTQLAFLNSVVSTRRSIACSQVTSDVTSQETSDTPEPPDTPGTPTPRDVITPDPIEPEPMIASTSYCERVKTDPIEPEPMIASTSHYKRVKSDHIEDEISHLLDKASEQISQSFAANSERTSTSTLFEALAKRIHMANLTRRQIILIENAVSEIVNQKLVDFIP